MILGYHDIATMQKLQCGQLLGHDGKPCQAFLYQRSVKQDFGSEQQKILLFFRIGAASGSLGVHIGCGDRVAQLMVVPVVVSICSIIIDPWVEEFFVRLIEMVANFCANATLVYLIWPSREGNHFLASTGLETGLSGEPGSSSSQDSSSDIQLQAMKP